MRGPWPVKSVKHIQKSGAKLLFTMGDFLGMNYADAVATEDLPALQSTFGPPTGVRIATPPPGAFDKSAPPKKATGASSKTFWRHWMPVKRRKSTDTKHARPCR